MNSLPPLEPLTRVLRRHLAIAACAAVLLTSFEDEVLEAMSVARASEATLATPSPDRTDELSLFPDLSPARSDRGEADSATVDVEPPVGPVAFVANCETPAGTAVTSPVARAGGQRLSAWLCVWLL